MYWSGNPGLVEFYAPFLSSLQEREASARLAILAHGHLNHTTLPEVEHNTSDCSLVAQVQSAIEAFDALKTEFGNGTELFLIGHSVGAWIASQVCYSRRLSVPSFSTLHIGIESA